MSQCNGRSFDPMWSELMSDLRASINCFDFSEVKIKGEAECPDDGSPLSQKISAA